MVEFEKIMDVSEVGKKLKSQHKEFGRDLDNKLF